jgi:group I intron endonuclease
MSYYVYQHCKSDANNIFYVGKGTRNRCKQTHGRNQYWHRVVNKHGFVPQILIDGIDEEFAFLIESEVIDLYRKRGIELVNATNGGEGASGYKHTEEHKAKLKGNNRGSASWGIGFKGKHHTEETKAKWSESRKGNTNKLGKKLTSEQKQKLSQAKSGKPVHAKRVLTADQVREIRVLLQTESIAEIARYMNVGESTIRRIRDNEAYKDVK